MEQIYKTEEKKSVLNQEPIVNGANAQTQNIKVLKSKILTSVIDLENFIIQYQKSATISVGLNYLSNATIVRVFYFEEGIWEAGYVVNANTSLRYFDVFNTQLKATIFRDCNLIENDLAEIACIWINRSLTRQAPKSRMEVYKYSVNEAINCNKKYIIGGSIIFTVWKTFELVLPKTLYFGLVPFASGFEIGKIVYAETNSALKNLISFFEKVSPN